MVLIYHKSGIVLTPIIPNLCTIKLNVILLIWR